MKRVFHLLLIFILLGVCSFFVKGSDAREVLEVLNIEIPVRVLYKGKPVDNLVKSDFSLFENGRKIEINGFNLIKKKVERDNTGVKREGVREKRRLFVIAFSLTDFNRSYKDGVNYLFKEILRDTDSLIIMINNVIYTYNDLRNREYIHNKINLSLKKEGKKARVNIRGIFRSIELSLNMLKTDLSFSAKNNTTTAESELHNKHTLFFLRTYKSAWDDFKGRFLFTSLDPFYNLSKFLKGLDHEKWAINFYQVEKFPMLDPLSDVYQDIISTSGNIGARILKDIRREFDAEKNFPADEVGEMFLSSGVRFDMVLVPSRIESDSLDIISGDVSTSIENTLRKITGKTGGRTSFSSDIKKSFREMKEREDIVYMLTFAPSDSRETGKIKVKLRNKKYKLLYDKNVRSGFISRYIGKRSLENKEVKIGEIKFSERFLNINIEDYIRRETGGELSGDLKTNLVLFNNDTGQFRYERQKQIKPEKETADFKFDLNNIRKGKYDILIDVRDVLSGKSAFEYVQVKAGKKRGEKVDIRPIAKSELSIEKPETKKDDLSDQLLDRILSGSAEYCSRLKNSAFHFYCKEEIISQGNKIKVSKYHRHTTKRKYTNKYIFDYQLINDRKGVREQRKNMSAKEVGKTGDIHQLVISFLSEKPVFAPVMILGIEGQKKFRFTLKDLVRRVGNEFAEIVAIPLNSKEFFFKSALIHVDTADYSIRRIKVIPRYIRGYDSLMRTAFDFRAKLYLESEIVFDKGYRGLWFPTLLSIIEKYKGGRIIVQATGINGFIKSKTIFRYDDYKFFNIDMDIKN